VRCPLVAIHDAPDPAPVLAFARGFAGGSCDDLILTTGEGLRRIVACIRAARTWAARGFLEALARVRKITRGPKPARGAARARLEARPARAGADHGRRSSPQLAASTSRPTAWACSSTAPSPTPRWWSFSSAPAPPCTASRPMSMRRGRRCGGARLLARLNTGEVTRSPSPALRRSSGCLRSPPAATVCAALARTLVAAVGPVVGRGARPARHQGAPHAGRVIFSQAADDGAGGGAARARLREETI